MKDFFEDFGKKISEAAEVVTNMTSEAIEIQKLKGQIRDLARENAVDLMEMGKLTYGKFSAGEEVEADAAGYCDAIKERKAAIADCEKKIAVIKGASECPECGKMVSKDMAFCPYCGTKAEKETFEEECCAPEEDIFEDETAEEKEAAEEAAAEEEKEEAPAEEACATEEKPEE